MSYEIELAERAAAQLDRLDPMVRLIALDGLLALSADPVGVSQPAPSPPYLPGYQMFQYPPDWRERGHRFTYLFKYRANESTLWIYGIGHVQTAA